MKKFCKVVVLLMLVFSLMLSLTITASATSRGKVGNSTPYATSSRSSSSGGLIGGAVKGAIVAGICSLFGAMFPKKKKKDESGASSKPPVTPTPVEEPVKPVTPPNPNPMETVCVNIPKTEPKQQGAFLFCLDGVLKGKSYPVGQTPVVIGRLPSCGICYPDNTRGVSRSHCQLAMDGSTLSITDLKSSFGTYVSGIGRIEPQKPVALHNGDTFCVGDKQNAFKVKIG